jgi:hypothetical protein
LRKLKAEGGYFNMQKQTLCGPAAGKDQSAAERRDVGRMLMDPTDISDVTGASTYHYLVNGHDSGATGPGCSHPASGCACGSSMPRP